MKTFRTCLACILMTFRLLVSAQTDYTSKITNPSFENDMTGWVHKSMNAQGNDVFTLKEGATY